MYWSVVASDAYDEGVVESSVDRMACSWGDAGSHSGKQTALHTMKRMLGWPVLSSWRGGLSIFIILLLLCVFNCHILTFPVSNELININSHLCSEIVRFSKVQIVYLFISTPRYSFRQYAGLLTFIQPNALEFEPCLPSRVL